MALRVFLRAEHDLEMASPTGLKLSTIALIGVPGVPCCRSATRHLSTKSSVSARYAVARVGSTTKEPNSAESSSTWRTTIKIG